MNNNNDSKRTIRDSTENGGRKVTFLHKASSESLNVLKTLLINEGFMESNMKNLELSNSLMANLFNILGSDDDDEKKILNLRAIAGLESELLVVYADQEVSQLNRGVLTSALELLRTDHSNVLTIGHLFLEDNFELMNEDAEKVGTYKETLGFNIYGPDAEQTLTQNSAGWLNSDEEKISFIMKNADGDNVTYFDVHRHTSQKDGVDISEELMPLYSNPSDATATATVRHVMAGSKPIVMSNSGEKPTHVNVNMDIDQPENLHYIIGRAASYTGSHTGCTNPKAIHYNVISTINEDPCVELYSLVGSEEAVLNNKDSTIDVSLEFKNDKINVSDEINLQGERQLRLQINSDEHDFSAHDDTTHDDFGSDTKGKLGNFEYELTSGILEIILEDGEYEAHSTDIKTLNAPITDTTNDLYTTDSNDPNFEKYNNGWEDFEYNLVIHDISTEETDSTHPHFGTHDMYYVNVPLKISDSFSSLTNDLRILGQIRKINKDGSHDITKTVSLNNAIENYGAERLELAYQTSEDTYESIANLLLKSQSLKKLEFDNGLKLEYTVNVPEGTIQQITDALVIRLKVTDNSGDGLNLDSEKDFKLFNLSLAFQDCTDEDANNYNSNANVQQLIADGKLGETMCIYSGCHDSTAKNYNESSFIDNEGVAHLKPNSEGLHLVTILDDLCSIDVCDNSNATNYDPDSTEFIRIHNEDLCEYRREIELSVERNNVSAVVEGKDFKNLKMEDGSYHAYLNAEDGIVVKVKAEEVGADDMIKIFLGEKLMKILSKKSDNSVDASVIIELNEGENEIKLVVENSDADYPTAAHEETIVVTASHLRCLQDRDLPAGAYQSFAYLESATEITNVNNAYLNEMVSLTHYPEFYEILAQHAREQAGKDEPDAICEVNGCSQSIYQEYDADATREDDSMCKTLTVHGCTVEEATNFNADAHVDDGSCVIKACINEAQETACNYLDITDSRFDDLEIKFIHDQSLCLFVNGMPEKREYLVDIGDEREQNEPEFKVNFITELGSSTIVETSEGPNPLRAKIDEDDLVDTTWSLEGSEIRLTKVQGRFRSVAILGHNPTGPELITSWNFHQEAKYHAYVDSESTGIKYAWPWNLELTTNNPGITYYAHLSSSHTVGDNRAINHNRIMKLDITNIGATETWSFTRAYGEGEVADTSVDSCDVDRIGLWAEGGAPENILYVKQGDDKLYTNVMVKLDGYYFNPDALEYGENEFKIALRNRDNSAMSTGNSDYAQPFVYGSKFVVTKKYTACTDEDATNYDSNAPAEVTPSNDKLCVYDRCDKEMEDGWPTHLYDSNCGDGIVCEPINGCKLEVCTDVNADDYEVLDEDIHIENNNLCKFTVCTDETSVEGYYLLDESPTGFDRVDNHDEESASDANKAIVADSQLKLNTNNSEKFTGALIITSPSGTTTILSSDASLKFNDARLVFPDGAPEAPEEEDFSNTDAYDAAVAAHELEMAAYNAAVALEISANFADSALSVDFLGDASGDSAVAIDDAHFKFNEWGTWTIQYIMSRLSSRMEVGGEIIRVPLRGDFDHHTPSHHARGAFEVKVNNGLLAIPTYGTLIPNNDELCKKIDPCDGNLKPLGQFTEKDACGVCMIENVYTEIDLDDNNICADSNGDGYEACPTDTVLDDCGVCRAEPTTVEGELVHPADWNQSCNDCKGNPDGSYVLTTCGDCVDGANPDNLILDLDPETNYCADSNSDNYGQCPEGHLDDCGKCHATAPTKNSEGEITAHPSGWNADCSVCKDVYASNTYEGDDIDQKLEDNSLCTYKICGLNAGDVINYGKTKENKEPALGSTTTINNDLCLFTGCADDRATNYVRGSFNDLNENRNECIFTYCDDEDACNYMSKEDKIKQIGTAENAGATYTVDNNLCQNIGEFDIDLTSKVRENGLHHVITMESDNDTSIGDSMLEVILTGNNLRSQYATKGDRFTGVTLEDLNIRPPYGIRSSLFGMYEEMSKTVFKINVNENKLYLLDPKAEYKNDDIRDKETEISEAIENKVQAASQLASKKSLLEAKMAAKVAADAALGPDGSQEGVQYSQGTLYFALAEAIAARDNAGVVTSNLTQAVTDAQNAVDLKINEITTLTDAISDLQDEIGLESDQVADVNAEGATLHGIHNYYVNHIGDIDDVSGSSLYAQLHTLKQDLEDSKESGLIPVAIESTWFPNQKDALPYQSDVQILKTYNLKLALTNENDIEYFGLSELYLDIQDNNYQFHNGEVRDSEGLVIGKCQTALYPTDSNLRLANSLSFGECSADFINLDFMVGDQVRYTQQIHRNTNGSDDAPAISINMKQLINDGDFAIGDEIVIKAKLMKADLGQNTMVAEVEKEVTLRKLGCTNSLFGNHNPESTMSYSYEVGGETIQSCRNSGCLDQTADNYDEEVEHADIDQCEYSLTDNKENEESCDYDSSSTLISSDGNNLADNVSWWGVYKYYCSDETSDLCNLWLESGKVMLNVVPKVNATLGTSVPFLTEDEQHGAIHTITLTDEYVNYITTPSLPLESNDDLVKLSDLYNKMKNSLNKKNRLAATGNDSVDVSGNSVADTLDHKASVIAALATKLAAANIERTSTATVYNTERTAFLNAYTNEESSKYDSNMTESKLDEYLEIMFNKSISDRELETSCNGAEYILVVSKKTGGVINYNDLLPEIGMTEINMDTIESINDSNEVVIALAPYTAATVDNSVMTRSELERLQTSASRSNQTSQDAGNELSFGTAVCDDTNASNYDAEDYKEVEKDTHYASTSACEYFYCTDQQADNYSDGDRGDLPGTSIENNAMCAYYYCNDEDACNYHEETDPKFYNKLGLLQPGADSALSVATTDSPMCFFPEINVDNINLQPFFKEDNVSNKLRGSGSNPHFTSNLLSTIISEDTLRTLEDFELTYKLGEHTGKGRMILSQTSNTVSEINYPYPNSDNDLNDIWAAENQVYSFTNKAQEVSLTNTEKFGYNIAVKIRSYAGNADLYLRVVNLSNKLFVGKLLINNKIIDVTGSVFTPEPSSRRVNKIFNHRACDSAVALALRKVGSNVNIDKVYGDEETFDLPESLRKTDEPVSMKIVALDVDGNVVHESEEFQITFNRTECGDSTATNYYEGSNNLPDNSECTYDACLDSTNCNYPDEDAPNGGSWVNNDLLCWQTNDDGECCPELNECKACGDLQLNDETGKCEHGDKDGECPEGMIEDRCGKCFTSEADEGFNECVGCMTESNPYYNSNATQHDESMCAICGDENACNYDSNATSDNSLITLCEYNTIEDLRLLPSLDANGHSKGYTLYQDFTVEFNSNIFTKQFTAEQVEGKWTIGDLKFDLEAPTDSMKPNEGNVKDGMKWRFYPEGRNLTARLVNGVAWTDASNSSQTEYNLTIQTADKTIYYIQMNDFKSNPRSEWNVFEDGQTGRLGSKLIREGQIDEDPGAGCETTAVEYELLRKSTDADGDEIHVVEASGNATANSLSLSSSQPGDHKVRLKPNCDTCDGNDWVELEFSLYIESCSIKEANNYDTRFDTIEAKFAKGVQNNLGEDGLPVSAGLCEWSGCKDEPTACNYSPHFTVNDDSCILPAYGKDCDGNCVKDIHGKANKDDCEVCHPLDVDETSAKWNATCKDCSGKANGTALVDRCGNCLPRDSEDIDKECTDCAGVVNGDSYLVYMDAEQGDKMEDGTDRFICTKTEKKCGDSNACNYDDAEDLNPLAIDDSVCTYPQGYLEGRQTADCDGNCLEGYTADCRGLCGLESDETFLKKDSCGWCGGSSQNCSPLNLVEGQRWQVSASCEKNSTIYDPHMNILSMYKIHNGSSERYELLWQSKSNDDDSISEIQLEPRTMLWIEIKDESTQDNLDEIHFMNLTAIQQLAKGARFRLGHMGVRKEERTHVFNRETNVLEGASIRGYADELAVGLVADSEKQTVLAEVQVNKRETNANGLVINNGEIDHFWMNIKGSCVVRLYHADMNNAGTVVQLVGPNGLTPIETREEGVEIVVGDNVTDQDVWVKVQIQNRIDDGSNFTDLITDSTDAHFDADRFNSEMEATKKSYETVIVAIERLHGNRYSQGTESVNIEYSLDGPDGIDA